MNLYDKNIHRWRNPPIILKHRTTSRLFRLFILYKRFDITLQTLHTSDIGQWYIFIVPKIYEYFARKLYNNYVFKKKINAILLFLDVPHIAQTHFDSEEPFQNKHNFSNILLICIVAIRGKPTIWIRWNYRETFFSCNDELK